MVYVHGGAHANGSGSDPLYDGVRLARRGDVVVVTVNHRLNVFGYCYLAGLGGPDLADSGNVGNMDLVMALPGSATTSPRSAAIPAMSPRSASRAAAAKLVTLMAMPPPRA
jgi:para-nitrobenzyl esterase